MSVDTHSGARTSRHRAEPASPEPWNGRSTGPPCGYSCSSASVSAVCLGARHYMAACAEAPSVHSALTSLLAHQDGTSAVLVLCMAPRICEGQAGPLSSRSSAFLGQRQ